MEPLLPTSGGSELADLTVEIIRRALDEELVSSPSEKGPLRIAFPHKVLDTWFPQLFTDLPVQEP